MVTIVEPLELSLAADRPRLEALRVRMATYIPCFPDTVEIRTALEEMPLLERLAVYTNWAHRLIPPRPPQLYGSGLSFGGPMARARSWAPWATALIGLWGALMWGA